MPLRSWRALPVPAVPAHDLWAQPTATSRRHGTSQTCRTSDRRAEEVLNSETFLLTNMSPQKPKFNRGIWKQLEEAVRDLANLYVEVYTVCGPLFDVGKKIEIIGQGPVKIPVPHSFFKSILAEKVRGKLDLWSFIFPNEESNDRLKNFLVPTTEVEIRSGLSLWDRLRGESADNLKSRKGRMWSLSSAKRAAQKRAAEREEQNG